MKYKYSLTDTYFPDMPELLTAMISSLPKEKPNRSKVGKKAYQTFLKNGGKRDSKGRFSKEKKLSWQEIARNYDHVTYSMTPYGKAVAWFNLFKAHGLIKEGVEI